MLESAWRRRFALLPMTLALALFAVGAAGFIATAGMPVYTRPGSALAEVAFALPVGPSTPVAPSTLVAPELVAVAVAPRTPDIAPVAVVLAASAQGPSTLLVRSSPIPSSPPLATDGAPWSSIVRAKPVAFPLVPATASNPPAAAAPNDEGAIDPPPPAFGQFDPPSGRDVVALAAAMPSQAIPVASELPAPNQQPSTLPSSQYEDARKNGKAVGHEFAPGQVKKAADDSSGH